MDRIRVSVCLAALLLAACDPGRDEPPPDVEDTIFDEQVKALDKARAVEDIQDEHMKKLREAEKKDGGS
jgi:hypothetical protein